MSLIGFLPDAGQARQLDTLIKRRLAGSLEHIIQQAEGEAMLLNIRQSFEQGITTVETSADLTERGQEIMAGTKAYMQQAGNL